MKITKYYNHSVDISVNISVNISRYMIVYIMLMRESVVVYCRITVYRYERHRPINTRHLPSQRLPTSVPTLNILDMDGRVE